MPLTPFHLGPAVLLKSFSKRTFSFTVFAAVQVFTDVEVVFHLLRRDGFLHGFKHTFVGAVTLALWSTPILYWFHRFLREQSPSRVGSMMIPDITVSVVLKSALIGTLSHVVFDGVMHSDLIPFWPWTNHNPYLRAISLSALHNSLMVSGVLGFILFGKRLRR